MTVDETKELALLRKRIKAIAVKFEPDYPGLADSNAYEQLWAIEQSIYGQSRALEDCNNALVGLRGYVKDLDSAITELVKIVAQDARTGHAPTIYKRGDVWRYHLDACSNSWEDDANPFHAAEKTQGRGESGLW